MALTFNNDHLIYYIMDATKSVGLVQSYFTHADCLVVQCWEHATNLYPDTASQTGSQIQHYVKVFSGMGFIPLGTPFNNIVVIIEYSNAAMPFVFTSFLALFTVLDNY